MNKVLSEHSIGRKCKFQLVKGDITEERVDAIVNAANSQLIHGAGVAGAIVKRGGKEIQEESSTWVRVNGPVTHESPAYTSGGKLHARYVIHAVGPVWGEGDEDEKLHAAILGSMKVADSLQINSIAIPALSTGVFGFPKPRAAGIILSTIMDYLEQNLKSGLTTIRLTLFDQETVSTFTEIWNDKFEFTDDHLDNGC